MGTKLIVGVHTDEEITKHKVEHSSYEIRPMKENLLIPGPASVQPGGEVPDGARHQVGGRGAQL